MLSIQQKNDKLISEQKNYFDLSSEPNVDIVDITVSIWNKHEFEEIFTSNDVINIQNGIGNVFGSRERAYSIGVN